MKLMWSTRSLPKKEKLILYGVASLFADSVAFGRFLLPLAVLLYVGSEAVHPAVADDSPDGYVEAPISDGDRDHWAFRPLVRINPPEHRFSRWRINEVDDFIAAELEINELVPQAAAPKRTLIRRLFLDVTGLPPTSAQIDSFLKDSPPDAWPELVSKVLADKGYGERWAQHWLDLARFAETDGFEHDKVRPEAWWYRDWVIDAFNADMPYDEFIAQQLAGDELYPGDKVAATATQFCLSGPDMPDINLLEERRHTVLNELTSTIGETLLGLQVGCAQCHDHKYDPISQADFYRLRAVFAPSLKLQKNKSLTTLQETTPWNKSAHVMIRGDFRRPGPEIAPAAIRVVAVDSDLHSVPRMATAGYRTALVQWLMNDAQALTARVMVNRIWQHHFGAGIVDTPNDFGIMGALPSNQPLLDWLAIRFVKSGWRLKSLHELILNSATYRQASFRTSSADSSEDDTWQRSLSNDPHARLLSRYPRWRLEGEAIRDSMLAASGQLNRRTGGPSVRPPLPKELVDTLLKKQWVVTEDESEHYRRSIYVFARRNLRYPIFEAFDRPAANASCAQRSTSTTAPQALHLLNSEFTLTTSRKLARDVLQQSDEQSQLIETVFLRILGRPPTLLETEHVMAFLQRQQQLSSSADVPLTHLCLSLFNSSEFIFVD